MHQSIKAIALFLVFSSLATMALGTVPKASATSSPTTGNMLIEIYTSQAAGEAALQKGDIDINSWPLSTTFIGANAANSAITMDSYTQIGDMEFDLNNQLWPTGPNPLIGGTRANPVGPGLGFFNPTGVRDIAALHFRRAIAHLTNKAKYTAGFMGGYGYVKSTPIPVPALQSYTAYATLANSTALADPYGSTGGYIYTYGRAAAIQEFWLGGFVIKSGGTGRVWFAEHDTLSAGIGIGVITIPIVGITQIPSGWTAGDSIQIGEGASAETLTLAASASIGSTSLTVNSPGTTMAHNTGEPVVDLTTLYQSVSGGETLPNMKLWARLDDPNRRLAGNDLHSEMLATGIRAATTLNGPGLDLHFAAGSSSFTAVMVNYDYNIYTGGWSEGANPDFLFDLYDSGMGQYAFATNYPGFQNHEYDPFAQAVKFAPDIPTAAYNAIQAQWVLEKYVGIIPLWAAKGVKGYRTGWTGVVNEAGYGIDNPWSFALMNWTDGAGNSRNGPANTSVYGLSGDPSAMNVISSGGSWPELAVPQTQEGSGGEPVNAKVLSLIYDSLLRRNPFSLGEEVGSLATQWNTSVTWPGWSGKTVAWYTLRTDAFFHNGDPVTPADVAYSILAVRDAGPGNAWNFPTVFQVDHVQIVGQQVGVFFNVRSAWALHWAGFIPIIDENLWNQINAIGPTSLSGYNGFIPHSTNGNFGSPASTYKDASQIRNFHPWAPPTDAAGHLFLTDDGSWGWVFQSYVVGNNVYLTAYSGMYQTMNRRTSPGVFTAMSFPSFINVAFHAIGNVNYPSGYGVTHGWYAADNYIALTDLANIANSLAVSNTTLPWGPGAGQYNPDADINNDTYVNVIDLAIAGIHFGQTRG